MDKNTAWLNAIKEIVIDISIKALSLDFGRKGCAQQRLQQQSFAHSSRKSDSADQNELH
jgi:hypothetical protein